MKCTSSLLVSQFCEALGGLSFLMCVCSAGGCVFNHLHWASISRWSFVFFHLCVYRFRHSKWEHGLGKAVFGIYPSFLFRVSLRVTLCPSLVTPSCKHTDSVSGVSSPPVEPLHGFLLQHIPPWICNATSSSLLSPLARVQVRRLLHHRVTHTHTHTHTARMGHGSRIFGWKLWDWRGVRTCACSLGATWINAAAAAAHTPTQRERNTLTTDTLVHTDAEPVWWVGWRLTACGGGAVLGSAWVLDVTSGRAWGLGAALFGGCFFWGDSWLGLVS